MQTRARNVFTSIHTEGAILPVDLLQAILAGDKDLDGLTPECYHLPAGEKLNEAINRAWNRLQGTWSAFQTGRERLVEGDPGTTVARERWLLPLFQELGYGRLQTSKAIALEGKSYPISHAWGSLPIHLVGCGLDLDKRTPGAAGAARSSPHSMLQEFLNRSDDFLWGMVSNGLQLRVLRDNASLTRQAYLEFDLEAMFEGEAYADFALLWLTCHQSRLEGEGPAEFWLECWSKTALDRGTRALDQLRNGVEEAITALGSGFLAHPANTSLKTRLRSGGLSREDFYRQLLRLVYRLIFLFVAEDRDLLFSPDSTPEEHQRYDRYYSTTRLRRLAERQRGGRHSDLYTSLRLVTDLFGGRDKSGKGNTGLGLPILGSFLFSSESLPDLETAELDNQSFLNAIRSLSLTVEGNTRRSVDYKNLGPEELGSVYESLLELHPNLNTDAATFELSTASGHERKTTGSYYTPSSLIQVLLDSALDPVIEDHMKAQPDAAQQEQALLNLKICDPACGSGHFLIAAAHRIAQKLASLRSGDEAPSPSMTRAALREVISHCIYGVDSNPMAVELCKVNLWLEALEPGKPLSFLDAHIQCGNSLVGVSPNLELSEIPDEAFNPAFGDDKATASALKKRNKRERTGQLGMRFEVTHLLTDMDELARWLAERAAQVDAMPEDDSTQVQAKAKAFDDYHATREYLNNRLELDLWTAAFFWKIPKADAETLLAPTQQELIQLRNGGELDARLVERVKELAKCLKFFHWELAFPKVFSGDPSTGTSAGFDCVLGNPPWERIKLQEEEFFAQRDPEIATAPNKAARQKLIDALLQTNPALAHAFEDAKHATDAVSKFVRDSGRFPLTAIGDVNTYALFAEHFLNLLSSTGRAGVILPTGIATDDSTKKFFSSLMQNQSIARLIGFENEALIFPAVHHAFKFCLLITTGIEVKIPVVDFMFFCRYFEHLSQSERHFEFSQEDVSLVNPNTQTIPVFRTRTDAKLTKKIFNNVPTLVKESGKRSNPWGLIYRQGLFHSANDANVFNPNTYKNLVNHGAILSDNIFMVNGKEYYLPLYEGRMIWQYDHRFGSYSGLDNRTVTHLPTPSLRLYENPNYVVMPYYWITKKEVEVRLSQWNKDWILGFRGITNSTNERTFILSVVPKVGLNDQFGILFPDTSRATKLISCLIANCNSIIFDYVARQKLGGMGLKKYILFQLSALPTEAYTPADIEYIAPRVLELVYTAYDLKPFAEDMGYTGEPFKWDEERRAHLRAELDAYYAKLYGLDHKQLRYILDPADLTPLELEDILDPFEEVDDPLDPAGYAARIEASTFPGETFRVLKEKEIRKFGEYRTRRLVLEAWDKLEGIEPATIRPPALVVQSQPESSEPSAAKPPEPAAPKVKESAPLPENPAQQMLSDFGLYKCGECGMLVMGYEKENHTRDVHGGKSVEWRKIN